ncbi:hypothetical protein EPO44_18630 [bacterium]|nr:MAG: hypothetical protein EPO44_18630 [bacterium]
MIRKIGLMVAIWFGTYGVVFGAERAVRLDSGAVATISDLEAHRWLPHSYFDQAIDSLHALHPDLQLLAVRRVGQLGNILYSLVCYKESRGSREVVVTGAAVTKAQAWRFDVRHETNAHVELLLEVLEAVAKLPSNTPDGGQGK